MSSTSGENPMQPRLYSELSHLWPIISPPHEYAEEAKDWRRILIDKLGEAKGRILELGAGGGHNLSHLTSDFQATAVDLSPEMLDQSLRLNPSVRHHLGDMRTVRLGQTFDAVLIHDAVGYMLTEADLRDCISTAKCHLNSGGLLLMAPDWVKEEFDGPKLFHWTREEKGAQGNPDIAVTIQEYLHDPDPNDTQVESIYYYMIHIDDKCSIERDTHVNGLFPVATWISLLDEVGFKAEREFLPSHEGGYGGNMFVGTLIES